ncbi:hypothetical protein ColTof4_08974 [Colletotrichum tofieldiae]|nr:hypothetical protein ColTof3_03819 [Colletotrichum tofieldiae]GKT76551.1 hypothetical protein ColTof4_08974 [Colletotrichum tofieldiae]
MDGMEDIGKHGTELSPSWLAAQSRSQWMSAMGTRFSFVMSVTAQGAVWRNDWGNRPASRGPGASWSRERVVGAIGAIPSVWCFRSEPQMPPGAADAGRGCWAETLAASGSCRCLRDTPPVSVASGVSAEK